MGEPVTAMTPDKPCPADPGERDSPPAAPRVSAIVLSRNGAAMLARLFESLAAHNTRMLAEIILVDHGSTDDTQAVVARWAGALPIRHVRCRTNHSYSWSTNRAAERAEGDYLVFLNNDIVLVEDILPRLLETARRTGGIVGVRQMQADGDGRPIGRVQHAGVGFRWQRERRFWNPVNLDTCPARADCADGAVPVAAVNGAVMMVERRLFLLLGGLDEAYFYGLEDVDLCLKASLGRGLPVTCLTGLSALHAEGGTRGRASPRQRRRRARANSGPFIRRWDGVLRRRIRRSLVAEGAIGVTAGVPAIVPAGPRSSLLETVAQSLGLPVSAANEGEGPALVCVTDPAARPFARFRDAPPAALIGLAGEGSDAWRDHPDLPAFDLLVADAPRAREALTAAGAPAACVAEEIREALAARLETPRAALCCLYPDPALKAVRGRLAHAGIASTLHPLTDVGSPELAAADVIVRAGALALFGRRPHRPVVELAPAETLAERVRAAADAACRTPVDTPLPDLARADFPRGA